MELGASRPSDLEQLGLLVLQHLVDRVGVLLGDGVQTLLGAGHVVLADLAVLLELLEVLLGGTPQVAHRNAAVLGLGLGDLDVLLAALLGELGEHAADETAVVGRVDPEVGLADRLLDVGHRALVVGLDQDHPRLGGGERRQLLQGGRRPVVVDDDLVEHAGVRATGPDRRELLARRLDRLVHLAVGLVEDVVDHGCSWFVTYVVVLARAGVGGRPSPRAQPALTSVPIFSPCTTRRMLPSGSMPKTTMGSLFSPHRANAVWSMMRRPRLIASS